MSFSETLLVCVYIYLTFSNELCCCEVLLRAQKGVFYLLHTRVKVTIVYSELYSSKPSIVEIKSWT